MESANDGVMKWGKACIGRDIVFVVPEVRSCNARVSLTERHMLLEETALGADLLQEIRGQHEDLGVRAVALDSA